MKGRSRIAAAHRFAIAAMLALGVALSIPRLVSSAENNPLMILISHAPTALGPGLGHDNLDHTVFSSDDKGLLADPFIAAIVGLPVWKRFTVTLNYPHATLRLAPDMNSATR